MFKLKKKIISVLIENLLLLLFFFCHFTVNFLAAYALLPFVQCIRKFLFERTLGALEKKKIKSRG